MIKKILISLLCLIFTGTSAFAAFYAKTFEAARKRNPKDGILVFFYGTGWDARSDAMLKSFWGHPEIKKACGDAAMVTVPVYQRPTEKEKERAQEARAGMRVPHIYSYPAVVMCDSDGNKYYLLQGDEIFEDRDVVAKTIKDKLELYRKQKEILKKAEKAKGLAKAKLYGEAMIEGIDYPKDAAKVMKECDPNNELPYGRRLEFDVFKLITDKIHKDPDNKEAKMLTADEAVALVTKLAIEDETTYLPWQRQELLSACAGHLRRLDKTDSRIKTLHKKIKDIDPDSVWAAFVEDSEEIWGGGSKKKKEKKKK